MSVKSADGQIENFSASDDGPLSSPDGRGRRTRGVGLIELLVALSISAALLTATGVALDAAFKAYGINQEQATLSQRARLSMNRIMTYIRTSDAHQPYTAATVTSFAGGSIVTDSGIEMLLDDGTAVSFYHDPTNEKLLYKQGTAIATLLNGVTNFTVKMEPMKSADSARSGGGYDLLMRATVLITLKTTANTTTLAEDVGQQTITLSSSVMPRRNVW